MTIYKAWLIITILPTLILFFLVSCHLSLVICHTSSKWQRQSPTWLTMSKSYQKSLIWFGCLESYEIRGLPNKKRKWVNFEKEITSRDQFPFIFGTHLRRHGVWNMAQPKPTFKRKNKNSSCTILARLFTWLIVISKKN